MDQYYQFCIPEPYRVCKFNLKPFSIGHMILLKRFENAFVDTSKDKITWTDLAYAVLFCSQDYQSAINSVNSWLGIWKYKRILKSIKRDFRHKCEMMIEYISQGRQSPHNVKWEDGEPSYAAPEAMIKFVLMSHLGYSEERALNMPYGQAKYEMHVWQESKELAQFTEEDQDVSTVDMYKLADEFEARIHPKEIKNEL